MEQHEYEEIVAAALWDAELFDKKLGRRKTLELAVRVMVRIDELLAKESVSSASSSAS